VFLGIVPPAADAADRNCVGIAVKKLTTLRLQGQNILRSKGILSVKGAVQRYVFQAVHMIADSTWGQKWGEGDRRVSKLVFIGRHLDPAKLKAGFEGCAE
jgi:G3E family GTPase